MQTYQKRFLIGLLLFLTTLVHSAENLKVSTQYYLTKDDLTLKEISKVQKFETSHGENFGILDEYCWLKIEVENKSSKKIKRVFEFQIPFLDYIDVYKPKETVEKYGQLNLYNHNIKSLNNAAFSLSLNEFEKRVVYVKIQSSFAMKTSMKNYDEKEYLDNIIFYKRIFDFIYGILVAMVIYNFFIWLSMREKPYLYYVLFHFIFILGIVAWTGVGFEYIWANKPWINSYTYGIIGNLLYAFNIFFVIYYLDTKKYIPRATKYLKVMAYIAIVFVFTSPFITLVSLYEIFSIVATLSPLTIIIYLMIVKNLKTAKYIFISKIFLITGNLTVVLSELGYINGSFLIDNSYVWGVTIEVIFMSFALSQKYKDLEYEKELEISKRIETEEILMSRQKLEMMGKMMNSLVHQWRQPLSQINSAVCSIENDYRMQRLNEEVLEVRLNDIESMTKYLSNTVDDFRDFSSHGNIDIHNMQDIMDNVLSIVNFIYQTNGIIIDVNYSKKDMKIQINKNQLIQVLMVILSNAKDTLIENDISKPKVKIDIGEYDGKFFIEIANNGGEIPKNIVNKIFDANFTTKEKEQGTGLGLYIAKLILRDHLHGKIEVTSSKEWTRFKVTV